MGSANPSQAELRAWALGVVGKGAPLPELAAPSAVTGARAIEVLDRRAALLQLSIDGEPITYLIQHTRGIAPEHTDRTDDELRAVAWHRKTFTTVVVGRAESAPRWLAALGRR